MSFEPVTLYQLVCDRCGHAREAVEEDERDKDRADAITQLLARRESAE